ncbi:MAG: hypothetical protein NTZ78_05215 [Candidatus Aureabacteria bacterium]|nr:hypothetical protein [Candidatus Auribacterota bacterium]
MKTMIHISLVTALLLFSALLVSASDRREWRGKYHGPWGEGKIKIKEHYPRHYYRYPGYHYPYGYYYPPYYPPYYYAPYYYPEPYGYPGPYYGDYRVKIED